MKNKSPSDVQAKPRFNKVGEHLYRYQNGNGGYYGIKKNQGKILYKSLKTTDRKLAERKLKSWLETLEQKTGEISLKALCDLFMETRKGRQAKTIEGYSRAFKQLLQTLGENTLAHEVRPLDISKLFAKTSQIYGSSAFNHLAETVNLLFELGLNNGFIAENPCQKVEKNLRRKRVIRKKPTIPTEQQFQQIINHMRKYSCRSSDLAEFLGLAAIGEAEAETLKWESSVDWTRQRINVQRKKTQQFFYIPLYPWLKPFITNLWEREGRPTHGPIFKVKRIKNCLYRACKALGLPRFSPRNLRQYGIVKQIRGGLPVKLCSRYQGHQDGGKLILSCYSEVFSSDDERYEQELICNLKV
jgi:integrase